MRVAILILLLSWFSTLEGFSQSTSIVAGEYFVDDYKDFGEGDPIPLTLGETVDFSATLSLGSLLPGVHRLYIRVKDSEDVWSQTYSRLFLQTDYDSASIAGFEYFFDNYVDFGQGTFVPMEEDSSVYPIMVPEDLVPGVHVLYTRSRASDSQWSHTNRRLFLVPDSTEIVNIVRLEYYFTGAEGFETERYAFYGFTPAPSITLDEDSFLANAAGLEEGKTYTLHVQAFSDREDASVERTLSFEVEPEAPFTIEAVEVTDASCSDGNDGQAVVNISGDDVDVSYSISTDSANYTTSNTFEGLAAGSYTAYVRDSVNNIVESREFTITAPEALLLAEESIVDVACSSDTTGSITVAASGGSGSGYEYRLGDGEYQASATFSELTAGTYSITVRDDNGCTTSEEITINFQNEAPPAPTVRRSSDFDDVAELSLIAENVAGATLQWYLDGEPIAGATGDTITIAEAGNYAVVATLGSCSSEYIVTEAGKILSVADQIAYKINVYPVPSQDQITLDVPPGLFKGEVTVDLLNTNGQLIKSRVFETGLPVQMTYDLSTLVQGTYVISIRSEDTVVNKRVSKL